MPESWVYERTQREEIPGFKVGKYWRFHAVDGIIPVKPTRCLRCQQPLQGDDPQSQRHQVTEIPPPKPVVTEYQWPRLDCSACGELTRAELPPGVSPGGIWPARAGDRSFVHGRVPSV